MTTPRRRFLGWLGSASLLGAVASPSLLHAAPGQRGDRPTDDDDAHAPAVADTWDMSWTARVTGRYKAVFDSPEASDGAALYRAASWWEQYKEVYNVERREITAVVVLRHHGFYFAMNDDFWLQHDIGKKTKSVDAKGKKWSKVNPVGPAAAAADPANKPYSVPGFLEAGGIVLACAWSFGAATSMIAKAEKLGRDEARARAKSMLLPGVILQQNGIFAALRAQEAGCAYIDAS